MYIIYIYKIFVNLRIIYGHFLHSYCLIFILILIGLIEKQITLITKLKLIVFCEELDFLKEN